MSETFDYLCPFCGCCDNDLDLRTHIEEGINRILFKERRGCKQVSRWWANDLEAVYARSCCIPVVQFDRDRDPQAKESLPRELYYFPRWLRACLESLLPARKVSSSTGDPSWATDDYGSTMRAVIEEVGPSPELQRAIMATFALGGHEALSKLYKPTPIMVVRRDHKLCVGSV